MLKLGSSGEEVSQWQAFLRLHGFAVEPDGKFGMNTDAATRIFQGDEGLGVDGIVGDGTYAKAYEMGFRVAGAEFRFIPAKWFSVGRDGTAINLIVLHTTEGPETDGRSVATAEMFHEGLAHASAHYICDPAMTTQSVLDQDAAWHAGHRATNLRSIGIEQNGTAQQTPEQWDDEASRRELANVAKLCAKLCAKYGIPRRRLSLDELRNGESGLVGHVDVTMAFNDGKGHHDPGVSYPWVQVLAMTEQQIALL